MIERFANISAYECVKNAIDRAMLLPFPVCITSKPGMGKTTALLKLKEENNYAYIEANQTINSPRVLYQALVKAYGIYTDRKFADDLCDIFKSRMHRFDEDERPRLLIVDEFQTLSASLQREILYLNEEIGLPVVFSGNPQRLAQTKTDKHAYEQITSRLGPVVTILPPAGEDCDNLGMQYGVEGMEAYQGLRHFGSCNSVREIVRLLKFGLMASQTNSIRDYHLKQAARLLYGDDKCVAAPKKGKGKSYA